MLKDIESVSGKIDKCNPKVSVIVPNYNHAAYLNERIDSILNQTYADFELILLDDCSTDKSSVILVEYKDRKKVSVIEINKQNSGSVFKQWEKGIQLAKGEYIWIAESDDWAEPTLLENLVGVLDENPNVGLVSCDSLVENGTKEQSLISDYLIEKYKDNRWNSDYIHNGKSELQEVMIYNCTIGNVSSVLFRKETLLKANVFDISLRYSGDWYCYLKVVAISDIAYINKPLNHFRRHTTSTSFSAGYNYLIELFRIYSWILKAKVVGDNKLLNKAFCSYLLDVYSWGLKWNPVKDIRLLLPENKCLYVKMTIKLLKRTVRSFLFNVLNKFK
jgi:glycosyltransferase involved in cell wall biosynthesis